MYSQVTVTLGTKHGRRGFMPPGFWYSFLGVELPKSSEGTAHPNKLGTAGLVRASIHPFSFI